MIGKRVNPPKPDTNFKYDEVLQFAWVSVQKCALNYDRQRFPEPSHIAKLLAKWNIICCTPLQARYDRKTDTYYIADGQQHAIAWVLKYGEDAMVPVLYVESDDENIESIQLLALNTGSEPMAKFFIHQTAIQCGDADAINLEKSLTDVDCFTSYKKKTPGAVTHISHLWQARDGYGLEDISEVLGSMRQAWPLEKVAEPTMLGFLKTKEILEHEGTYTEDLLVDIIYTCSSYFSSAKDLHLHINHAFQTTYPTNYKGMGVREKIASGILSVYEQAKPEFTASKPFEIKVSVLTDSVDLSEVEVADDE
jgi:hypothetical protein